VTEGEESAAAVVGPESGINRNAHAFGDIHAVDAGSESP